MRATIFRRNTCASRYFPFRGAYFRKCLELFIGMSLSSRLDSLFSLSSRPFLRFLPFARGSCVPAASQRIGRVRLHAHFPIRRNLLIASFPDEGRKTHSFFLAEKISGPDHAIDFHASSISVFLSRSSRLSPEGIARTGILCFH